MGQTDNVTLLLLAANVIFSLMAFNRPELLLKYAFQVGPILQNKEYHRILTGGFLHGSSTHLIVNMLSLYFCGPAVGYVFGMQGYLLIYFGGLIGGNLLALLIQRNNPGYRAVGASGAISGVIFALCYFAPNTIFLLFFIIPCPAWLFALLYVGYSLFGMRNQLHNIGHEAHLGGAAAGMLFAILLIPQFLVTNWWVVLILFVPTAAMTYVLVKRPDLLMRRFNLRGGGGGGVPKNPFAKRGPRIVRDEADRKFHSKREELDYLLDLVAQNGYDSLKSKQKQRLDELSGTDVSDGSGRPGGV